MRQRTRGSPLHKYTEARSIFVRGSDTRIRSLEGAMKIHLTNVKDRNIKQNKRNGGPVGPYLVQRSIDR